MRSIYKPRKIAIGNEPLRTGSSSVASVSLNPDSSTATLDYGVETAGFSYLFGVISDQSLPDQGEMLGTV